ncbi:hypothetical protein [Acinetobacter calcoaceticus]|uniref:hypothetical protein n=1 Tax=Acinetobacter calcoaceticus TaxID=471 RepID=UPI001E3D6B5D|nr:hypothetical protein [Acinetobacter calcoaceticus]UGQ30893.1 hypothetical protein LRO84_05500 [Acinetobacter calcoaceticus]
MVNIWPTPKALDWNKRRSVSPHPRNGLLDAVVKFPTSIASVSSKWDNQSLSKLKVKGHQIRLSTAVSLQGVNGGRLNPNWVEWLMVWPIERIGLKLLEMNRFQSWLKAHLNF